MLSLLVDSLFVLLLSLIGGGSAGFGDVVSSMAFDVAVSDDDGVGDAFLSAVSCASGCFVLLFGTLAFDLGTMVTNIAVVIVVVVVDVGHFGCVGYFGWLIGYDVRLLACICLMMSMVVSLSFLVLRF